MAGKRRGSRQSDRGAAPAVGGVAEVKDLPAPTSAREPQALAVFLQCRRSVLIIEAGLSDAEIQVIEISLHRGSALINNDSLAEADKRCS